MKAMEKINAVVTAAQASKIDSLHRNGIAMEGIANDIKRHAEELKEAQTKDSRLSDFTVWYIKGLIDGSLQALKSIIVCSGLAETPEGKAALKINGKEFEEDA